MCVVIRGWSSSCQRGRRRPSRRTGQCRRPSCRCACAAAPLPNQRFLVIESLKSPSGFPFFSFAGPIIGFLQIMSPRKQLEGCWLEKEGFFPTVHPGRSTGSVSNMALPFKLTVNHLKVWLLLHYYGGTSARTYLWLKGVLL